jgi:hypothetical protein
MQIESFFKKNDVFTDSIVAKEAALATFERGERICRIANKRLDYYYTERGRLDPDLSSQMSRMEAYIRDLLGSYEVFLEELPHLIRFTSGATSKGSRRESLPTLKIHKNLGCSTRALPYVTAIAKFFGYGDFLRGDVHDWNRVETVPKNWKTDRTIACEPGGNIPLQLAFDSYCKRKLRKWNIDLSDQSLNQELARRSSLDDSLATIDLSMASDTLSYNTVAWLLPDQWFKYLDDIRSPLGKLSGSVSRYAKFSSMGNGATFALETLVFAAACKAVGSKAFSVYGDDIIIEKELANELIKLLKFLGFSVNLDKSYLSGPFKESCGTNWYEGVDITPFYWRTIDDRKATWCHNINGLVGISVPRGELWKYILQLKEELKLPLVPFNEDSMSGIWISVPMAYRLGLIRTKHWIQYFKAYKPEGKTRILADSRSLFLTYLDKFVRRGPRESLFTIQGNLPFLLGRKAVEVGELLNYEAGTERSRVPILRHRYVRKWVHWQVPVAATPDHLYWWSEDLVPK